MSILHGFLLWILIYFMHSAHFVFMQIYAQHILYVLLNETKERYTSTIPSLSFRLARDSTFAVNELKLLYGVEGSYPVRNVECRGPIGCGGALTTEKESLHAPVTILPPFSSMLTYVVIT